MTDDKPIDPIAPLPSVPFESRQEFERETLAAFGSAQREIWLADASFRQWSLNSVAGEELMHSFLAASRANRIHLLVADDQYLSRDAPRFMRLIRLFGQSLVVRRPPDEVANRFAEDCSFAIVDRARMVRRFHRDSMRGVAEFHPNRVGPWLTNSSRFGRRVPQACREPFSDCQVDVTFRNGACWHFEFGRGSRLLYNRNLLWTA